MKSYYRTEKYKKYQRRVTRHALKHRQKRKKIIRVKRTSYVGKPKMEQSVTHIIAPKTFSFLTNPHGISKFLNQLESILKSRQPVFVKMQEVEEIDYGAIAALLSIMYLFKTKKISFNGDFPNNIEAKKVMVESGFLYRLFENSTHKSSYSIGEENQMITQVEKSLDPTLVAAIVDDASNTVWGHKKKCGGLYEVIIELINNTYSHASKKDVGDERWWLSVNHNKQKKTVNFVFIDYGIGIFTSLAKKPNDHPLRTMLKIAEQKFGLKENHETLKHLLTTASRETSSAEKGHGWGLHRIYQTTQRSQIHNLHVISNNAYGDTNNDKYYQIKPSFNGTLFYWEINYSTN